MSKSKIIVSLLLVSLFIVLRASAQNTDSLINAMSTTTTVQKVEATFKSTRLVLSQSTETQKAHDLNFLITHHFGDIGGDFGGSHTLYGLDVATDLYIGFDYGITDRLTVGLGRSKRDELFNLFVKDKLIQQSEGGIPFNLTLFAQSALITRKPFSNEFDRYSNRLSYLIQPIFSRKFSRQLSLQVAPSYLSRGMANDPLEPNNLFTVGFAGRLKLTKRLSLIADYTWINGFSRPTVLTVPQYNPLGLGLEIETGGHVFSLNFMNSEFINENAFLSDSKKSWTEGGVRFGFSIARSFTLFKSKNPETQSKIY